MGSIMAITLTATSTGGAGTSTGSADSEGILNGYLVAVSLDYTGEPNTTDVTLAIVDPALTLLTVSNSNTDTTTPIAPRLTCVSPANSAITDSYDKLPIIGKLRLSIAQGDNNGTVAATIYIERLVS